MATDMMRWEPVKGCYCSGRGHGRPPREGDTHSWVAVDQKNRGRDNVAGPKTKQREKRMGVPRSRRRHMAAPGQKGQGLASPEWEEPGAR